MSETAVEPSTGDSAVGSNGVDESKTENTDTDSSKPASATDAVLETIADPKLKSIPHADKSTTKASKEHNSEESKSPAKRKVTATEKSSDDEDSIDSPAKKKSRTESHNSEESESDGDTKSNQNNKAKKGKVVSEDEQDDEEEEEDDAAVEPGLLERPVVLEAGVKREKKKTQRLDITPVMKKVEVVAGEGTKLGDIPGVEFHLARAPSENLKVLHRVLFDRVGSAPVVKKNIRQFCGFGFLEGSADYKKKHDKLSKMTNAQLKFICEVLHIERGGKKDEITNRILHFLLKPHDSGKPVPTSGKKKRRSSSGKKTSSKKSKSDKPKAKKKAKSALDEHKESGEDSEESDEEHEEEDDDDDDDDKSAAESASDSDHEMKKKKKETKKKDKKSTPAKKSSKATEKTPKSDAKKPSKKPAGGSPKKKTPTPKKSKHVTVASDDSSDEDSEPIQKSTAPTDDVLRNIIKKILKTANLEEVTMKTVCKQVYDKFPEFDLTARKDFIKATVKQILK